MLLGHDDLALANALVDGTGKLELKVVAAVEAAQVLA